MSKIGGVINIIIGIGLIMFSSLFFSKYFGGNEKELIELESLLSEGQTTMAVLDSVYTELTIKGIKVYSSKYFFRVNEKEYTGNFNFDSPSDLEPIIQVYYRQDDPNINKANVEGQLKKVNARVNSKMDLYMGVGFSLLGLLLIYFRGIRRFQGSKED